MTRFRILGFTHLALGDLFLEELRRYREERLARTGLIPFFPLFGAATRTLAREMIDAGFGAILTCVDPKVLAPSFAGREFDASLLDDLQPSVAPCAERGEFHSVAFRKPMFRHPIAEEPGAVLERDGYVCADVLLGVPGAR